MPAQLCPPDKLEQVLIPHESWQPSHRAADREGRDGLSGPLRQAQARRRWLSSWVRITHMRGRAVEIVDEYELSEPSEPWRW